MNREGLRHSTAFLVFAGLGLAVCAEMLLGPYGQVRFHDTFDNNYFHEFFQARQLLAHGLSFWTDKLGGLPSFAGLYPPYGPQVVFSLIFPPWLLGRAFDLTAIIVSGYGLFRLLADYLGADRRAALLVSVPFALTGYAYHSLAFFNYFPLFFMLVADVTRPGGWRFRLPRVLGIVLMAYCSMPVLTLPVYSVLHLLLVLLFDTTPWRKRRIAAAFVVWTGYALFFAPTLASLLAYAPLSNRILPPVRSLSPWQAILGLKDSYGYVLSICIPLTAGLYFALEAKGSLLVRRALFLCLGLAAAIQLSSESVKPLFGATPLKYVDFYHFSGALMVAVPLLAGLGLSHMLRSGGRVSWLRAALCLGATGLVVSADNLLVKACVLLFVLGGAMAAQLAAAPAGQTDARRKLGLAAALCGLGLAAGVAQMHTQLMMDHSFVPYAKGFGHHQSLLALARDAAKDPFRVAGVNLSPVVAKSHGLDTADLLTQIYSRQYRDYFEAIVAPQLDTPEKRENYPNVAYREAFLVPCADTYTTRRFLIYNKNAPTRADMWNLPLLSAMNVRYLLSPRPVEGLGEFADLEVLDNGAGMPVAALAGTKVEAMYRLPLYVYRLHDFFPRGWLVSGALVLPGESAVRAALETQTVADFARRALMSAEDAVGLPAAFREAVATTPATPATLGMVGSGGPEVLKLVRHTRDSFEWTGEIAAPRLLVVSNNYHSGWRALVNGTEVPVLRANQAFQAVPLVRAGPVRVELSFHDPLVAKAHGLTLLGLLLMCSCVFLAPRAGGRETPAPCEAARAEQGVAGAEAEAMIARGFRLACAWGAGGVLLASALFLLLRALREPADSGRLVWFILCTSTASGLLAAPLAGALLRALLRSGPKK